MSKCFWQFITGEIFFQKWKILPLLEASSVVIGNCLDSFPPIFFIYLKIFVTFSYFWVIFFYIFRDKIRIWSQEKLMTIAWFSSDYAEFFLLTLLCSVIICDVSCCFSRSSSVKGAKIQTRLFLLFHCRKETACT